MPDTTSPRSAPPAASHEATAPFWVTHRYHGGNPSGPFATRAAAAAHIATIAATFCNKHHEMSIRDAKGRFA